ncbi:MAG: TRAP transporter small permease subunit, partial [Pseudomonadota bacterium]
LSGAIELSGFALSVTVFAALPGAALRGLARVDILLDRLPDRLRRGIDRFWFAILGGVSALLAWLLMDRAATEVAARHLSQDLGWPLWPFTAFAALAAMLLAIAALAASLRPRDAQDRAR